MPAARSGTLQMRYCHPHVVEYYFIYINMTFRHSWKLAQQTELPWRPRQHWSMVAVGGNGGWENS